MPLLSSSEWEKESEATHTRTNPQREIGRMVKLYKDREEDYR